jgi:hypothetical protein
MLDTQYSLGAQDVGTKKITRARDLREAMSKYVPTDSEFEQAFATARVSRPHLARYYLRALEKTLQADRQPEYVANEDLAEITLEHVTPLAPSEAWDIDADDAKAAQRLLGNMVLLKADRNRDLGAKGFAEKKAAYAESQHLITQQVAEYDSWTLKEIRDRQAKLAKVAVQTWHLKFSD